MTSINTNRGLSRTALLLLVAIVVIAAIVLIGRSGGTDGDNLTASSTDVAVSETTKISSSVSEFKNSELGFSVQYPSAWEREEVSSGVNFIIPIPKQVNTLATLQANVQVFSKTCAFPPVTTVQERNKITVGDKTFDMIAISNKVQGRTYFDRMYSLQSGSICYMFTFKSITSSTQSKGLTGSNATQAENNNKAIINTVDAEFTNMVKSFAFVTTEAGKDETQAAPKK